MVLAEEFEKILKKADVDAKFKRLMQGAFKSNDGIKKLKKAEDAKKKEKDETELKL